MRRIRFGYDALLRKHPLGTQVVTSGIICAAGDALTQVTWSDKKFDLVRNMRMGFIGATLVAPSLHVWYGMLPRLFPGTSHMTTVKRVMADQLVFTPPFLVVFFGYAGLLEQKPMDEVTTMLKNDWAKTVALNWLWWVPTQMLNFGLVPLQYQILFSNISALVWNSYLSFVANK